MADTRLRRIESLLREEICSMISKGEIKDPRVESLTTVTEVNVTRDLGHAKVWVSRFGDAGGVRQRRCPQPRRGLHPGGALEEDLPAGFPPPALPPRHSMENGFRIAQKLRDVMG